MTPSPYSLEHFTCSHKTFLSVLFPSSFSHIGNGMPCAQTSYIAYSNLLYSVMNCLGQAFWHQELAAVID